MSADHNQRMSATPNDSPLPQGAVPLPDWGVIRATGTDARSFLHGQLTQDTLHLEPGRARLAGYCSPKGRLLASFVIWTEAASGDMLLACSADLLPATLKRLSMFVLRAKCKLGDASAALPLHGWAGSDVPGAQPWQVTEGAAGTALRLPDAAGQRRALWLGAAPPVQEALAPEGWQWLEVMSAVPRIVAATVEQFVPQMINLEAVGGVNFQKGCYPGQEVVARSQYRGTLKRRAFLVRSEAALQPGQEVFDAADPEQPAGMVVMAAAPAGLPAVALVELKTAAAEGRLSAVSPEGPRLTVLPLPYDLPTEV
ncbi:MAG: folate-binding protein YgfZ [Rubrivivax sp.]|nr:folate-binding protein YgfZ [Betaproteobacteria bacterium]MBP6316707.1 folate-binding protein YgfZ [Rubrivivax sp.]MBK7275450.1 folate-binding protein YgfZ [Betaproteobacteria bacterium]MBK7458967.1 folate-binding protein YgfZ [Betaproteobacteria bacterium]MBK7514636.1 folate-binding protein YgfZ [Betaproteobacteria bacterium]